MSQCASDERHLLACVSAISKDTLDEGKQSPCPAQQMEGAITILNISRMNDDVQQEASVSTRMCRLRPLIFLPAS